MDTEDQIPPILPFVKGGISPLWQRGAGEIFATIRLFNYGLLSNYLRDAWRNYVFTSED